MKLLLLIIAIILFVLQAAGLPQFGQFQPGWLGLAFGFGALAIPPSPSA